MPGTVTVACKLPNGLILRNFEMVDYDEPVMGGGTKTQKMARQIGGPVKIDGVAAPYGVSKFLVGAYAFTHNVDKDFFDKWMADNKDSPLVTERMIYANEKADTVEKRSIDNADARSGLEPLSQTGDARIPRGVKKDDGKAAA